MDEPEAPASSESHRKQLLPQSYSHCACSRLYLPMSLPERIQLSNQIAFCKSFCKSLHLAIMSDTLRIEPATLDDLPKLADLLYELFSEEADFTPNRDKQLRGLKLILEQPSRGRIFVLRNERRIIGMINLLITISTAEGGFVLLLEDLIVHVEHRRQGYGSRLLRHAIEFAREKKFLRITLLTDKPNEAATRFYVKHGFTESDMMPLRMWLPSSSIETESRSL